MEMRLDVAEKKAFVRAAELAGMSLSGWVRTVCGELLRRNWK